MKVSILLHIFYLLIYWLRKNIYRNILIRPESSDVLLEGDAYIRGEIKKYLDSRRGYLIGNRLQYEYRNTALNVCPHIASKLCHFKLNLK